VKHNTVILAANLLLVILVLAFVAALIVVVVNGIAGLDAAGVPARGLGEHVLGRALGVHL
jgi:hypothetical protein